MAHDVFICHSAKDKTTADAVCAMLEASGVRCWIAPRDVTAGMEWSECIIDAIEECRVMVLVFTTNANESGQIRREIERAVNRGVAILPLRIEDILPARALEYFIGNVHWLDALTPPLESHLQNLAGTVKILLGRLPQHGSPTPHAAANPPAAFAHTPAFTPTPANVPAPVPPAPRIENVEPARRAPVEPAQEPFRVEYVSERREEYAPPREVVIPVPPVTPAAPPPHYQQQAPEIRERVVSPPPAPAAPANASPGVVATEKLKRPIGVTVVVVVDLIFAGLMVTAYSSSSGYQRDKFGIWFILLGISGAVASYGVFKLKNWGRALDILLPAMGVVWLISEFQDASRDGTGVLVWLALLVLFGGIIWYMCTRRVKLAFGAPTQSPANSGSAASAAPAQQNPFAGLASRGTGRRPGVVLFIAILSFIEAGIWVLPIWNDFSHGRAAPEDFGAFLLVCAAAATGFGLMKLMGWARFLKVIVSVVDAVLMISAAQEAFREGGGSEAAWIGIFIFIVWSAWFMFTPRVKQAFSKQS